MRALIEDVYTTLRRLVTVLDEKILIVTMKSAVTSLADSNSLRIIYRYGSVICRPIPEAASLSRLLQLLIGCLRPGHLHRERETLEHCGRLLQRNFLFVSKRIIRLSNRYLRPCSIHVRLFKVKREKLTDY
jgi:hypothetical protein